MLHHTIEGADIRKYVDQLVAEVNSDSKITVLTQSEIVGFEGFQGNFKTMIRAGAEQESREIKHGVIIVATGGTENTPKEFLYGEEASFFAFTDGKNILPLASSQDHKQIFDGDQGPNTGGMGAYSPAPVVTDALYERIVTEVVQPTIDGMAAEGTPYQGILFVGLMIDGDNFKVLEFNARFGDPEAQPLLCRMKSDLVPVLQACARGELNVSALEWYERAAVCVVLAAGGYPGSYPKGDEISGIDAANAIDGVHVFHAGTAAQGGHIVTAGGRVLGVTGWDDTIEAAIAKAYAGAAKISWDGMQMRRDIGQKARKRA
jgi:phosphoribosylamine--glycine ligase